MPWGIAAAVAPAVIGAVAGGSTAQGAAKSAAGTDLTGYNYLTGNAATNAAQTAGTTATGDQTTIQGNEAALLGGGTPAAQQQQKAAYGNYLNSTGYNFQTDQGMRAITGNAASRGLLGSGGDAKALMQYGQGQAAQGFNNYLGQLSNTNSQAATTSSQGLSAATATGGAGTSGGIAGGTSIAAGGAAMGNAITTAGGLVGGAVSNYFNTPTTPANSNAIQGMPGQYY